MPSDGASHARISWPMGTQFVNATTTGIDAASNLQRIECRGAIEIRDAFRLPKGDWNPAYLTLPKFTFIIQAGTEGFSIELPDGESEMRSAIYHIGDGEIRLRRLREIAVANRQSGE